MEAKSANMAEEVPKTFYRIYSFFAHRLRGLGEVLQFQWTPFQLRNAEGTCLEMRKACHNDLQNEKNRLQKL